MPRSSALAGEPLVTVTRGPLVESVHAVAACAVEADGNVLLSLGTVDVPVFLRSSSKPFIAAEVVRCGAADAFGFDDREIALIAASHGGESFHVETVRGMLAKIGLDESALRCGPQAPSYEPAAASLAASGSAPSAVHNNCSGKHAGILAACVHAGVDVASYSEANHPVERRILEFCGRLTGESAADLPLGVDGCGIPVFATSLRRAALAFARFATLEGVSDDDATALARVSHAMASAPEFVAGTGRFDTALLKATGGRIVGKAGAEAVHADALLDEGAGLALKVTDGSRRAMAPATFACLDHLGALKPAARTALERHADVEIRNWAGRSVGRITATFPDTIPRRTTS